MPKKKEPQYSLELKATGTTLDLIETMHHLLDMLHHGDHTRRPEWTVQTRNMRRTTKKL